MNTTDAVPLLAPALPEIVLAIGALGMVLYGAIVGLRSFRWMDEIAIALLVIVGLMVATQAPERAVTFSGAFVADAFGQFMKLLAIVAAIAALVLSRAYLVRERLFVFEYSILMVLATLGTMLMISANDLIALYVGLELQSLALYVIAAIRRDDARSSEAGLKYFVLGALSSGMLLYGASMVYGFAGSVSFPAIAAATAAGAPGLGLTIGLVFVMAGLAFKMAAVPFHMWTPDVYEGAPTPVTAFFASVSKIGAVALAVRVLIDAFPGLLPQWQQIVVTISIGSMALGALAAIGQTNIKRLMAYSSIGHVGYVLVGLAAGTPEGAQGVAIYMAIYVAMTIGAFALILAMVRLGLPHESIFDLAGLSRTRPAMAYAFAAILFSLAGIPPLAGFFAKFYVFAAAMKAGLVTLAVIGVIASTVSAYYYLRIVKIMFFDEPRPALDLAPISLRLSLAAATAVVVGFVLFPQPLVRAAEAAARSLFL